MQFENAQDAWIDDGNGLHHMALGRSWATRRWSLVWLYKSMSRQRRFTIEDQDVECRLGCMLAGKPTVEVSLRSSAPEGSLVKGAIRHLRSSRRGSLSPFLGWLEVEITVMELLHAKCFWRWGPVTTPREDRLCSQAQWSGTKTKPRLKPKPSCHGMHDR